MCVFGSCGVGRDWCSTYILAHGGVGVQQTLSDPPPPPAGRPGGGGLVQKKKFGGVRGKGGKGVGKGWVRGGVMGGKGVRGPDFTL